MNNINEFKELALCTRNKIIAFGTTSKTVLETFDRCVKLLSIFLKDSGQYFSEETALKWLEEYESEDKQGYPYTIYIGYRRIVLLLIENDNGNLNTWKCFSRIHATMPINNEYLQLLSKYKQCLENTGYRMATIAFKFNCAKQFLIYLEYIGMITIINLKHRNIANYLITDHFKNRKPAGVQAEIYRLRHFITFLEDNDITNLKNLHYAILQYRLLESKIVTTITEKAESSLLDDYPTFPANKRDKAIYLLALRTGLRGSDIHNLKFSDINWDKKIISITQLKTDVPLTLPLDTETSNALIEYILNERRETEENYIFITAIGPIRKLTRRTGTMKYRLKNVDISKDVPHLGLHILRRTYASRLLKSGAELAVITSALGQVDPTSINVYLSTDENNMKRCALGLQDIPCTREEY